MIKRFETGSKILNGFVLLTGSSAILGWMFDIEFLRRPFVHSVAMNPSTGVAFIFSSLAFILLTAKNSSYKKRAAGNLLAALVAAIGLIKFSGIIFGFDAQIDHILFSEKLSNQIAPQVLNRMAPNTAFFFMFTGTALLLLNHQKIKKIIPGNFFTLTLMLGAMISILGYVYHVSAFYGVLSYIPMALHTAFAFLFMSFAILFAYPDSGIMKEFNSPFAGGAIARKLIPPAILFPLVLGIFRIYLVENKIIPVQMETEIVILSIVIIFLAFIYNYAISVNKKDMARKNAEDQLKESLKETSDYKYALDESSIVAITDQKGIIKQINDNFCKISKYRREELIGQDHRIINSGYHSKEFIRELWTTIAKGRVWKGELKNIAKDGTFYWVDTTIVPFINEKGKPFQYIAIRSDITQRKKIEEVLIENQQIIQSFMDNTSAFIYVKDLQGKYILTNNSYKKFFGIENKDLVGKTAFHLVNYETALLLKQQDEQLVKENKIFESEIAIPLKNSIHHFLTVRFPLTNASGEVYATGGIFSDITDIKEQSELIKDLYDNAPTGYYSLDADGKFMSANNTTLQWLDYTKEELIGKPLTDLLNTEEKELFKRLFTLFKEKGYLKNLELSYTRKNGTTFPVLINSTAVKNEAGHFLHTRSTIVDITKRKKLELALKESNDKFLRLFYSSPLAMIISNLEDGKILDVNEEYERLLGYKKEELLGKTYAELGMIVDPELGKQICRKASQTQSLKNIEATLYNSKKEPINIIISIEKILLENKDCIISGFLDITERKKTEDELQTVNKELESFTYSVSHDLRAPLRIINGYAQIIKEGVSQDLDEEPKRMLENIIHNAKQMGSLIDDLLNFSRLGRRELVTHDTDMNVIVKPIMEQQLNGNTNYTVKLHNLYSSYCDSSLIKQVWENLISNAVKYSAYNANPVIEIGSVKENNSTVYFIKDNGAGFDMKYYDKLFGVFQRLHKTSEFEGTGVGLALTQRIILKHGGRIWAESKVNEGSTFYFTVCKS